MKKNFLFFCFCLLSSISFSDCFEDCQQFKSSQLSVIQSLYEDVLLQEGLIGQCYTNLHSAQSQLQTVHGSNQYVDNAEIELVGLQSSLTSVSYYNREIRMLTSEANTLLQTLDCSSSSSNSNCCPDLSTIESRLFDIFDELVLIYHKPSNNYGQLQEIRDLVNYIAGYYEFLVWDTGDIKDDVSSILTLFEPFSDSHNGVLSLLRQIADSVSNQVATVEFSVTNDFTIVVSNSTDVSSILSRIDTVNENLSLIKSSIDSLSTHISEITNQLSYTNFLLEHGFHSSTNLLIDGFTSVTNLISFNPTFRQLVLPALSSDGIRYLRGNGSWNTQSSASFQQVTRFDSTNFYSNLIRYFYNQDNVAFSINNMLGYTYRETFPFLTNTVGSIHRDQTNYFSFFRGELGVQGVLSDWTSEEADGSYHDFLTNHYISVVRGGSLSGFQSEKTNWFARIETLLAALVFVDGSDTNAYASASDASSNSVNNVKDTFNSIFDGVSSAPSSQMELAGEIEKSMYKSLQSFSKAFSSASLPSNVRLLYVSKDGGGGGASKGSSSSSGGSVDVSVDVDGKLSEFIEILRSCSTLCWVFFGLWFMFKFVVWTVKKIYFLIRYIIDFFNMVAGGR